jgi:N-acetylglucosaminyl-diphospho-decaprenol L-rhamnosyltransferase
MAQPMSPPEVTIQIVNYKTRKFLEACVRSVVADVERSGIAYEMNILDNASGDQLDDLLQPYPRCNLLVAERNQGFGAGHNRLARIAQAPYLLLVNPDIEFVHPGTVAGLTATMARPDVSIAGPRLAGPEGHSQRWDHGRIHGLRAQISYRAGHSYWRESSKPIEVAWVSGASMLVKRDVFERLGGFDESFFLYKEDEDLCLRARRLGGTIVYNPRITVLHHGSVVAGRQELERSTEYFIDKHFGRSALQPGLAALHRLLAHLRL